MRELGQKQELAVIGFHIMRVEENRRYRLHRIQVNEIGCDVKFPCNQNDWGLFLKEICKKDWILDTLPISTF